MVTENKPTAAAQGWLAMQEERMTIWTIGHSTRTLDEFIGLITANAIEALADVRRYPSSRKYPHFNQDALHGSLAGIGVEYVPLPELGGRRRPSPDSPNTAWRNESFRGYADYMETEEFHVGVDRLMGLAFRKRTVMMCAEAVWWRCHRSLIADYLKSMGVCVRHIIDGSHSKIHSYTSAANIRQGKLSYSSEE